MPPVDQDLAPDLSPAGAIVLRQVHHTASAQVSQAGPGSGYVVSGGRNQRSINGEYTRTGTAAHGAPVYGEGANSPTIYYTIPYYIYVYMHSHTLESLRSGESCGYVYRSMVVRAHFAFDESRRGSHKGEAFPYVPRNSKSAHQLTQEHQGRYLEFVFRVTHAHLAHSTRGTCAAPGHAQPTRMGAGCCTCTCWSTPACSTGSSPPPPPTTRCWTPPTPPVRDLTT